MDRTRNTVASALVIAVLLTAAPAWATTATEELKTAVDRVLNVVRDTELAKPANLDRRRAEIRAVAREMFDFPEMARRALGRHWAGRTPEQQEKFTDLFSDLLESSYIGKIELYGGEMIEYLPELSSDTTVTVRTTITTQDGTVVPLHYRMRKASERWVVFDVIIEGVSLVANYRTQFNRIISQDSFEELVARLEQKVQELAEDERTRAAKSKAP